MNGAKTLLGVAVTTLLCTGLLACASNPCLQGQELRENRWQGQVKARGCVARDA